MATFFQREMIIHIVFDMTEPGLFFFESILFILSCPLEKRVLLELRRQVAHLCFGIILSVLLFVNIVDEWFLAALTGTTLTFIFYWKSQSGKNSFLKKILHFFERDEHIERFPGRGFFFFLLGSLFSVLLFPREIALASILILSIGDSISHIYGRLLGRIKIPLCPKKNIEGHIIAALLSALAITAFIPFFPALIASILGMIVEIPHIELKKIPLDDNLLIPLISGGVLYFWNSFFPFLV